MPQWPKGRAIEETCGYIAKLTLFVGLGSYVLGWIWPYLGEQTLWELGITIGFAGMMGAAWLFLRYDKLQLARCALILNGAIFAYAIYVFTSNNFLENTASMFDGLAVYVGCTAIVALFWWSQFEVAKEINRRKGTKTAS